MTQGNGLAVIGIIDVGVDLSHDEFAGRISGEDHSGNNHGTHVAGIAAAQGDNGIGVAGVTWDSHIYAKNISDFDAVDIYNSVIDAITNGGADVINNSWGGPDFNGLIHIALGIAHDLGVLVVVSRGNDSSSDPLHPASYPGDWILSVGAFNTYFTRSDFSSYGSGLDIMAPGGNFAGYIEEDDIYSTSFDPGYCYMMGTSMAAPHVSGLVGLLKGHNQFPAFGSNSRRVIIKTASDMYDPGYDNDSGYGRLNARAALDYISRPRSVYSCETDTHDPYIYNISDYQQWAFLGLRDMADGVYIVKQYEVRERDFY